MDLVVEGFTSQAIALRLGISQRTVESYRVQIVHGEDEGGEPSPCWCAGPFAWADIAP